MKLLNSIATIEEKLSTQGSRPVRLMASDLEHYIAKYPFTPGDSKLINEYLANQFARRWEIEVPETVAIQVDREHIPESILGDQLSYMSFDQPVIGFRIIPEVIDSAGKFIDYLDDKDVKSLDKKELLKISLFDIWLSNEDRTAHNNNILFRRNEHSLIPIAIDHECIFNTGSLSMPIYELSYEDSILYSGLFHRISKNSKKFHSIIEELIASLPRYIDKCTNELDEILDNIPEEWGISTQELNDKLHQNVLNEDWVQKVIITFKEFVSLTLKKA